MRRAARIDCLLFFTLLAPVVRRNLPLAEALRRMVGEGGIGREHLEGMARDLDEGYRPSEAMAVRPELFPHPLPALVAAGEQAGDPASAVERCADLVRGRLRAAQHLQAALLYPAICLVLVVAVSAVFLVLNPLANLSGGRGGVFLLQSDERPDARGIDLFVQRLVFVYVSTAGPVVRRLLVDAPTRYLALLGVVGLAVGIWRLLHGRRTARKDRLLLNLPVVGRLYRWSAAAGFARALGTLLVRGVPVDKAVAAAIPATGNLWIEAELGRRLAGVRDGESLSGALALPGVFPPSLAWRLTAGEARGNPGDALVRAALAYEEELEIRAGRLARIVEPGAMILVGVIAILLLGALIPALVPLFQLIRVL